LITDEEKHIINGIIEKEYVRSLSKYGNWNDRYYITMIWVIFSEMWELLMAFIKHDFYGKHGVIAEAAQVSACIDKLIVQILRRKKQ